MTPNAREDGRIRSHGWRVVAFCSLAAVFTWGLGVFGASVYLHEVTKAGSPAAGGIPTPALPFTASRHMLRLTLVKRPMGRCGRPPPPAGAPPPHSARGSAPFSASSRSGPRGERRSGARATSPLPSADRPPSAFYAVAETKPRHAGGMLRPLLDWRARGHSRILRIPVRPAITAEPPLVRRAHTRRGTRGTYWWRRLSHHRHHGKSPPTPSRVR